MMDFRAFLVALSIGWLCAPAFAEYSGPATVTGSPAQPASLSGTGFPAATCSAGQTFLATDTKQIWDCTDGVSVWTNRVTGVTSSGAAALNTGLLARYDSSLCTSTTLPDSSGNGNTGTFATGSGPNFGAAPTCVAGTGVTFNGVYTPASPPAFNTLQFINLPSGALTGAQTDIIYVLPATGGAAPSTFAEALFVSAGTAPNSVTLTAADNKPIFGSDGVPSNGGSSQQWRGVMPLAFSHCGGNGQIYYQGKEVTGYYNTGTIGAWASGTGSIGGIVGSYIDPFIGTHYYEEHYSGCLTQAQINTETARINAILYGHGVTLGNTLNTSAPVVVFDGTSITEGYNIFAADGYAGYTGGAQSYFGVAVSAFGSAIQMINNGVSSQLLSTAISKIQSADLSQTTGRLAPVVILDYPTNDIQGAAGTVATAETNATTGCATIHAGGARCVLTTVLPCTAGACSGTFSANRTSWNTWVRANWTTIADGYADPASDPTIGTDAAAANTAYYGDGHHPTRAADAIIAKYYVSVISQLTGIQPSTLAVPHLTNIVTICSSGCTLTTSGGVATYTPTFGMIKDDVATVAAGGGGGGGAKQAASTACSGGSGGGGAGLANQSLTAAQIGASVSVTVGAGGAAGAAASTTSSAGGTGGIGGDTIFGALFKAKGGNGGAGGQLAGNSGGGGGGGLTGAAAAGTNAAGGAGSTGGGTGGFGVTAATSTTSGGGSGGAGGSNGAVGPPGGLALFGATGGGAGGGITAGNGLTGGGAGGSGLSITNNNYSGGAAGASNGGAGGVGISGLTNSTNQPTGSGGGGGGSSLTAAGAGATGGLGGGGGGGGGCVQNGGTAGAGGIGGDGLVVITEYF